MVRQEQQDGVPVYLLHTIPGADQFILRSREEALAQAVAFAKTQRVRAWFRNAAGVQLLDDFRRIVPSSRPVKALRRQVPSATRPRRYDS